MRNKGSCKIIAAGVCWLLVTALVITSFGSAPLRRYIGRKTAAWGWDPSPGPAGAVRYFSSAFETRKEAAAAAGETALLAQAEGTVLLENNGALPLGDRERRVCVFGTGAANMVRGDPGSDAGSGRGDLCAALEQNGFSPNPALRKFYRSMARKGWTRGKGLNADGTPGGKPGKRNYGWSVNEVEAELYPQKLLDSFADYHDAAILVISREGGAGQCLPVSMEDYYEGDDRHYLELTEEELTLLNLIREAEFPKVIVLLNTLTPFEAGFLKDGIVDAALWIGGPDETGLDAVAKLLTGALSPEGRLCETFAADLLSAPAMENCGDRRFAENSDPASAACLACAEGIYVGYRYYETRYTDTVTGLDSSGRFDYDRAVVYPFGYGLSYTDFRWSAPSLTDEGPTLCVTLGVTNTGSRPGKDVAELYLAKPYTAYDREHGLEKAAVELVGFAKTETLEPGQRQDLTIRVQKEQLASYDTYGCGTYLAEAGTYYFVSARNAHEAASSILVRQGFPAGASDAFVTPYFLAENQLYDRGASDHPIGNCFETQTLSSRPEDLLLLTRSDWAGSWPALYDGEGEAGEAQTALTLNPDADLTGGSADPALAERSGSADDSGVTDSGAGLVFADLIQEDGTPKPRNDPDWLRLVGCMRKQELCALLTAGRSLRIDSIHKPAAGFSDWSEPLFDGIGLPCRSVLASSWNLELAAKIGAALAEDGLWNHLQSRDGPDLTLRRIPFDGGAAFGEDGTLAGLYAARLVRAARQGGLLLRLRSLGPGLQAAGPETAANRETSDSCPELRVYASEQTLRELWLKPFRLAVEQGGAASITTACCRIGDTRTAAHSGLLIQVLRGEWGMDGAVHTALAGGSVDSEDLTPLLQAGGSQWPDLDASALEACTGTAVSAMQQAAADLLYAEACTALVNQLRLPDGSPAPLFRYPPLWMLAAGGLWLLLTALFGGLLHRVLRPKNRQSER